MRSDYGFRRSSMHSTQDCPLGPRLLPVAFSPPHNVRFFAPVCLFVCFCWALTKPHFDRLKNINLLVLEAAFFAKMLDYETILVEVWGGGGGGTRFSLTLKWMPSQVFKGKRIFTSYWKGTKITKHIYVPRIVCFGKSIVSFQRLISRHRWFAAHNEWKVLSSATFTFFLINDSL